MKSIVQEGSSVAKAVEKALQIAGNPREFTVKVLEEPQKNFFGMTTKSAKISLFFDIKEVEKTYKAEQQKIEKHKAEKPKIEAPKIEKPKVEKPAIEKQKIEKKHKPVERQDIVKTEKLIKGPKEKLEMPMFWTEDMVSLVKNWLSETMSKMDLTPINFKIDVNRFYLRITFTESLNNDEEKERQIFRSFSYLILQTLRTKLQRPLRGFKVVLTRGT